ncbi:MAG TPA: hypothetical protein IGS52_25950 [Oscillatoriaceae cyanobacterium M33_DOE_052]|uniref:Uncharacterized protein n=1 Tax=Planktothricoides sp. SpSt-374 TaxID=2282167 RepID=A0A7C3VML0_9CYAN|nr:hypothetical protein [Oscillatoriaceae cyanobacterium M33_DOE_052]
MTSVKEQIEAEAKDWIDRRRDQKMLLNPWATLHAICWVGSDGAKKEGYSENLAEFVAASKLAVGMNKIDQMLNQRDHCSYCGTRFRVENLSLCRCGNVYCYKCIWNLGIHPNGNRACYCGGEVVG